MASLKKKLVETVGERVLERSDSKWYISTSVPVGRSDTASASALVTDDQQSVEPQETEGRLEDTVHGTAAEQQNSYAGQSQKEAKKKRCKLKQERKPEKTAVDCTSTEGLDSNTTLDVSMPLNFIKDSENYKPTLQLSAAVKEKDSTDKETPKTAYEYLRHKTLQSMDTKLDSKGFNILKSEVRPQIRHLLRSEMVALLKKRVLYNNHDIVVLDKPYGMVIHGKVEGLPESCILTSILPELAAALAPRCSENNRLYTVHRLDRDVTGVLLLAKTQRMADTLQSLLERREVTKMYWAITRGVPSDPEGIIDIPIAEGNVGAAKRMVLCPRLESKFEHLVPKFRKTFDAVTRYRILDSNINAAYLELNPVTGFRHQLRVHLGLALRCPILGDHKYSHLRKLAPQKLPGDMLQRLGVRQTKVRDIPLHLHARRLVVPEVLDGRNLVVIANLPHHFAKNLKRLKLKSG